MLGIWFVFALVFVLAFVLAPATPAWWGGEAKEFELLLLLTPNMLNDEVVFEDEEEDGDEEYGEEYDAEGEESE